MSNQKTKKTSPNKIEIGYSLISEEHQPNDLVNYARLAEETGFTFATISDHFHPWTNQQGSSPFVWSVIGAISQVTKTLQLGTAVTCPTIRIHPAIIAQAAATAAAMMPNRFFLGLGTGENLNEHILGSNWPSHEIRKAMLEEAVEVMQKLWQGENTNFYGNFYIVENAKIYTLPKNPIPIIVAAEGPIMAKAAGKFADGLMTTQPEKEIIEIFKKNAGANAPIYGQITCCYAKTETEGKKIAYKQWPTSGLPGALHWELATPSLFEKTAAVLTEEKATQDITCGNDPKKYIEVLKKYLKAGHNKISIHNIGPDQDEFFCFYKEKLLPEIEKQLQPL